MKPPICLLCDQNSEHPDLIYFADYKPDPEGVIGHPQGMHWFCGVHAVAARKLVHLNSADAILRLKKTFRLSLAAGRLKNYFLEFLGSE